MMGETHLIPQLVRFFVYLTRLLSFCKMPQTQIRPFSWGLKQQPKLDLGL